MTTALVLLVAAATPLDPLVAAFDAHDAHAAGQAFAADGVVEYRSESGAFAPQVYRGRAAVETFFVGLVEDAHLTVDGDRVELQCAHYRALGVEKATLKAQAETKDGLLTRLVLQLAAPFDAQVAAKTPAFNKARVLAFYERLSRKDDSVLEQWLAPAYVQHTVMPLAPGVPGVKAYYAKLRASLPDFHQQIEDALADGDRVALRMTVRFTHKGEFMGVQATGRVVQFQKTDFFRLVNGRVVEHWDSVDRLGMLEQMGEISSQPAWRSSPGYESFR